MSPAHKVLDRYAAATAADANEIRRKIEDLATKDSPPAWRYDAARELRDIVAKLREDVLAAEAAAVLAKTRKVLG